MGRHIRVEQTQMFDPTLKFDTSRARDFSLTPAQAAHLGELAAFRRMSERTDFIWGIPRNKPL
ncbi:hypothetical protein BK004_02630 [bacterium CG10_46_32]|nr:MAG: hypothetical protein BK004_02630 [bacterium CG10_46_32]PIR56097.1 MAG: hypothetical protein COU73_02655 [Parcubacteria group bacterium CG10_big_fil_rev_8_21_14_0_10_46_32]